MTDDERVQEAQEWLGYFSNLFYSLKEYRKTHCRCSGIKGHKTGERVFDIWELSELIVMCRCIIGDKKIEDYLNSDYIKKVSRVPA